MTIDQWGLLAIGFIADWFAQVVSAKSKALCDSLESQSAR